VFDIFRKLDTIENRLYGKNTVCFGDSITQYGNYPYKIQKSTGAKVYNVGFGGCRMAMHEDEGYNSLSMCNVIDSVVSGNFNNMKDGAIKIYKEYGDDKRDEVELLSSIDFATVDIITIAYGTNDFGGKIPLGKTDSFNKYTFNGAINYTLNKLTSKYPHLKVYLFTPMYRTKMGTSGYENADDYKVESTGLKLLDYVEACIERSNYWRVHVYDSYRSLGIDFNNSKTYLRDGLHQTKKGDNLIYKNYLDFLTNN